MTEPIKYSDEQLESYARGKTVSEKDIKRMSKLTSANAHTEALIYLYDKVLNNKSATKALQAISTLHRFFGSMPRELQKLRDGEFLKPAMARIKDVFDKETADKIKGAF